MTTMQTIARAAMGAATRIYCDELDGIIDRHFPEETVEEMPWDDDYQRDYWPLKSAVSWKDEQ